ncbi:MAG: TIGR02536 family ethanolamine utilization protein [Romboutsia sp.]|uniref:TIGR02536 family ethanolamine utilization protein n=1 Tax=Romboutsia sp. TaxID=1965302 RepID=UPI003F3073A2
MNYDNLVNLIVDEIYKKINNTNQVEQINKPKAILLYEENNSKFDFIKDEFDIVNFDNSIKDCDIVILSKLCMRGISNLALGNSTSDEERFALEMLMKGKKVYILKDGIEYKRYRETAPKALYSKYLAYEDEICKFGVEVIKDLSSITLKNKNTLNKDSLNNEEALNKSDLKQEKIEIDEEFSLDLRSKKLISETDLRKPMVNGIKSVLISKKSIITPLATDFMRVHHLKLKRM